MGCTSRSQLFLSESVTASDAVSILVSEHNLGMTTAAGKKSGYRTRAASVENSINTDSAIPLAVRVGRVSKPPCAFVSVTTAHSVWCRALTQVLP